MNRTAWRIAKAELKGAEDVTRVWLNAYKMAQRCGGDHIDAMEAANMARDAYISELQYKCDALSRAEVEGCDS